MCVNETDKHTLKHTQTGGSDGLVSTCPPCHYPGGDGGEQSETREGEQEGWKEGGINRRDKQKKKRDRKSRDLSVT